MLGFRSKNETKVSFRGYDRKFKSIQETYNIYAFILSVTMMYPNPKTDKIRRIGIAVMSLCCVPIYTIFFNDIRIRLQNNDIENLVRQVIVCVSLSFVKVKAILTIIYRKELLEIFDSITEDYAKYNDMSEEYQQLVLESIKRSKFIEMGWTSLIGVSALVFPGTAIILNIYTSVFTDTPRRFMVHECYLWNLTPEQAYSSPVYEIFFVYSLYIAALIFLGFTGYDGMFSICVFHVSLKIKILSKKLQHIFDDKSDLAKIKTGIAEVVKSQRKIFEFKDKLVKCYESWLVMIFIVSGLQCSMALSQLATNKQSGSLNIIFLMFVASCVGHIFLPCHLTSDVTHTASQFADVVYGCSWEDVPDPGIRRSLCFMIARAQISMDFTALNLLTFNMEMFVSVMQSAYSMFTILRR